VIRGGVEEGRAEEVDLNERIITITVFALKIVYIICW
jgi:hypothetical protein